MKWLETSKMRLVGPVAIGFAALLATSAANAQARRPDRAGRNHGRLERRRYARHPDAQRREDSE